MKPYTKGTSVAIASSVVTIMPPVVAVIANPVVVEVTITVVIEICVPILVAVLVLLCVRYGPAHDANEDCPQKLQC